MRTESASGIESRPDYRKWSADLSKTPLFKGLSADEVACLLLAMQPRACGGRPERGHESGYFRAVVACDPPQPVSLGAHEYSMPRRFTPGMLMAEVSALAGVGSYQAAPAGKRGEKLPELPWQIVTLELSPGMLVADHGSDVARLQIVVLGNLSRMMAQKVVDARQVIASGDLSGFQYSVSARKEAK